MLATLNNWALSTTTDVLQYITTPKQEQNKTTSILITSATPTTIISQTPTTTPTTLSTINYKTGKQTKQFKYILNGNMNNITFDMYYGIMNKISSDTHPYSCMRYTYDTSPCNNTEIEKYYIGYIENQLQTTEIKSFADQIKKQTPDKPQQAKIVISLVQNIPYNWSEINSNSTHQYFPYETLFNNMGICSDKSLLLASLLKELEFDTILFDFKLERHMAVGIKCDPEYQYKTTGYCFVESTTPSIITDSSGDYVNVGKLTSDPIIYHISSGTILNVNEEYNDVIQYNYILTNLELSEKSLNEYEILLNSMPTTTQYQYSQYKAKYNEYENKYNNYKSLYSELLQLQKKYGLTTTHTTNI
jgi:hypothetical protein